MTASDLFFLWNAGERVENDSSYVIRGVIRNTNRGAGLPLLSTRNHAREAIY